MVWVQPVTAEQQAPPPPVVDAEPVAAAEPATDQPQPELGELVEARSARRGDDLFLSSVQMSGSEFQTMLIRRVSVTERDVLIELGGTGGGGWDASERRVRLVLPPDHTIRVRPR